MSVHATLIRSPGSAFQRSPAHARLRDVIRGGYSLHVKMARARRAYWGFPPFTAGPVPPVARYTNKVVAPAWK